MGVEIDEELIISTSGSYEEGLDSWGVLSAIDNPPTAIFAGNDEVAIGLIHGIQDQGKTAMFQVQNH